MVTIMELMLEINNWSVQFFYHKDTNTFDRCPVSSIQLQTLDENARIPMKDENNFHFLTFDDIDHNGIMRFYVRECVDNKEIRKYLFNILRRTDFVHDFVEGLNKFNLYDDFEMICGDIYEQIFFDWAEKQGLNFENNRDRK